MKRLLPLFIAKFLLNFVLWYTIEKLFMYGIGFSDASIAIVIAIYSVMSVVMEVPSGILADRWSRKGVMMLAAASLALSSLLGWLSEGVSLYIVSSIFWGFFDAFASGTASAMIYDALKEEQGHARNYHKVLGSFEALGGVALIVSALLGGVVGSLMSLRMTFLLTAIIAAMAMIVLYFYKDTAIHKESTDTRLLTHTKRTFAVVLKNHDLIWIVIALLALFLVQKLNGEFYQLWYVALAVPTALFGVAGAFVTGTYSSGGLLAGRISSRIKLVITLVIMLIASAGMTISSAAWLTVGLQFILGTAAFALLLAFTAKLQHHLPSRYRAGAGSVVNTVGRLLFTPVVLLFGLVSNNSGIFTAGWIIVVIALIATFAGVLTRNDETSRI